MPDGTTTTERFPLLPPELPPAEMEEAVLRTWEEEGLFDRVEEARRGAPEWVFYEGPPTANGRPGIHHVFSRTIKDLFCRHRVMRGHHVTRKAGWDTHGLPVEIEVEKQLGISGKQEIERFGVEAFNRLCRESVWKYKDEWEKLSARIGYALDYRNAYITYTNEYVESVWWALKTLFDRDLLYRGHKILPYCPRCGTALSSHEVAQGYEDVQDPSVYVALELEAPSARRILVWTTTPWTLVSNVALAVHPELEYVELRKRGSDEPTLILAEARAAAVLGDDYGERWEVVARMPGSVLAGMRYRRPLDWVAYEAGEHEVIVAESFVSAEDGSGVVHMAPAFGADDYAAGQRHGLAFLQPVNARGEFPPEMPVVGGMFVKAADPLIVEELRRRGVLWKAGTLTHAYPHCWRCSTPLLYYARESWFIRTTEFRDAMMARNAGVDWHPEEVGAGRFGAWLENNIDWALSRDRYWGTPLPVWVCDADSSHVEAIGSYAELEARLGAPLGASFDPHKPYIDRLEWRCGACDGTMRRVPEVIDTWFDSGSMPFAQWHYPFENREVVERLFPADFICEGVDQTRGWFYSLLAIATGLRDALPNNAGEGPAPYKAVVVNDLVLDANGVKMSKRLGNIVNPWEVIARHGADAVRMFLIASSQVWVPRRFDESAIRELSTRFLLTLKNTYSGMFAQYANYGWEPSDRDPAPADRPAIDRWVLSRLASVAREVDGLLERFEATLALRAIMDFVVDDVSNWYVRLSRARFYETESDDNRAAFATLHEVLVAASRMLAPFAPFVSDWLHRALIGTSVHLAAFPQSSPGRHDAALEAGMAHVRVLSRLGRAAREEANVKVRQPLGRLVCVVPDADGASLAELVPLLAQELNVKTVEFVTSGAAFVRLEAKPSFRVLGKRFGKRTPLAAQAIAALSDEALRAFERGEEVAINVEGEEHRLLPDDLAIVRRAAGDLVVEEEGGYFAALDPTVTPELRGEGLARELVSRIQRMRRDAGLAVSDRIALWVWGSAEIEGVARGYQDYISGEVLAVAVVVGERPAEVTNAVQAMDLDGVPAEIAIRRKD
ncbi:MAG TPA: isoleucine--tRNA ligase [Gemmatimonadaceae bacterium]|nr:isoleucine--tRNA ligase [Gemmatimonadaceae bacterium]